MLNFSQMRLILILDKERVKAALEELGKLDRVVTI